MNRLNKKTLLFPAALLLLAAAVLYVPSATGKPPVGDPSGSFSQPDEKRPRLVMAHIRAGSPGALKALRTMPLDIVRVRPAPRQQGHAATLEHSVIVEAVVPRTLLPALKAKGFDVVEIP